MLGCGGTDCVTEATYVCVENSYCQLHKEDYILDVSTTLSRRKKSFYFLFQRTSWVCPLHVGGSDVYFEMMYNQVRVAIATSVAVVVIVTACYCVAAS